MAEQHDEDAGGDEQCREEGDQRAVDVALHAHGVGVPVQLLGALSAESGVPAAELEL